MLIYNFTALCFVSKMATKGAGINAAMLLLLLLLQLLLLMLVLIAVGAADVNVANVVVV